MEAFGVGHKPVRRELRLAGLRLMPPLPGAPRARPAAGPAQWTQCRWMAHFRLYAVSTERGARSFCSERLDFGMCGQQTRGVNDLY